jgi:hypothetical protein
MRKRSFSVGILIIAFLMSAWGNVIAAAFCPRFALNHSCTNEHKAHQPKQVENASSCHHEMAGMEMNDMEMEHDASSYSKSDSSTQSSHVQSRFESSSDQVAFDLPIEQCPHCWSHSQPTAGSVSTAAVDPSKQLVETDSPPANLIFASLSVFPILITPSEHGPPGIALPRHVLINVFRI